VRSIAVIAEIEERKKKLAAERADNDGALLELDNVKNAKLKDEQKIEQLTKGWRMEREQVTIYEEFIVPEGVGAEWSSDSC